MRCPECSAKALHHADHEEAQRGWWRCPECDHLWWVCPKKVCSDCTRYHQAQIRKGGFQIVCFRCVMGANTVKIRKTDSQPIRVCTECGAPRRRGGVIREAKGLGLCFDCARKLIPEGEIRQSPRTSCVVCGCATQSRSGVCRSCQQYSPRRLTNSDYG
jgi:hypothetical protein